MITAVIATRNDPLLAQTIASLRNYCHRVIVVDDASTVKLDTTGADGVLRNKVRLGPGPSRHKGAMAVTDGWILFCDSHMVFPENWYSLAMEHLDSSDPNEVWGAVYESNVIFDSFWHDNRFIGGADFYFWRHNDLSYSFADLKPRRPENQLIYDVPCLLGGCYFIHHSWFREIGGYSNLIGYGSEEAWLSWSTWLRGGYVRIMGDLKVVHIYQKTTSTPKPFLPEWESNRLTVLKRILGPDEYAAFCSWLPISSNIKYEVESRCQGLTRKLDTVSHEHVCRSFNLQTLGDAYSLMMEYHRDISLLCEVCQDRRWIYNTGKDGFFRPCQRCNPDGKIDPKFEHFILKPVDLIKDV